MNIIKTNQKIRKKQEKMYKTNQNQGRVLVVDDEPLFRVLIPRIINPIGYQTIIACSTEEAKQLIEQDGIGKIVTDRQLGDGEGTEVISYARELGKRYPCILMSGRLEDKNIQDAFEAGANVVVQKPFTGNKLNQAMRLARTHQEAVVQGINPLEIIIQQHGPVNNQMIGLWRAVGAELYTVVGNDLYCKKDGQLQLVEKDFIYKQKE